MKINTDSPPYVVAFAAVISAVFTAGIMSLHIAAQPLAERNERLLKQRSLLEVFELCDLETGDDEVARLYNDHIHELEDGITDPESSVTFELYRASRDGKTIGYAFNAWGTGFWARIDAYLAVSPEIDRILGISFIKHSETPGLGGRITEPRWREKFRGLRADPPKTGDRYIYISRDKPLNDSDPLFGRQVDAITGATGTSNAVQDFLNTKLAQFRRAMAARPAGAGARGEGN